MWCPQGYSIYLLSLEGLNTHACTRIGIRSKQEQGGVTLIQTKQKIAGREARNKYKPRQNRNKYKTRTDTRTTPHNQTRRQAGGFWHSICHICPDMLSGIEIWHNLMAFCLAFDLAFCLTFCLTFDLAFCVAVNLVYVCEYMYIYIYIYISCYLSFCLAF